MAESLGKFTSESSEEIDYFDWTVNQIEEYLGETDFHTLADVYEAVIRRWVIEDDNTYDFEEGTTEYAEAFESFNEWDKLRYKLEDTIVQIVLWLVPDLKEEDKYSLINTFMNKNGYENMGAWWMKPDEMDQSEE